MESITWSTMMLSMAGAGVASQYVDPRTIGAIVGRAQFQYGDILGLGATGPAGCPSPALAGIEPEEIEVHGDPVVVSAAGQESVLSPARAKRIGRGIALRLAQAGARVAIHYDLPKPKRARTAERMRRRAAVPRQP